MAVVGNTNKPSNSWHAYGVNNKNHEADILLMPVRGRIYRLGQWMGGYSDTSVRTRLCCWDGAGTLLGYTAEFTVNTSSAGGPSGGSWLTNWEADLLSPVIIPAGNNVYVGFARNPADSHQVGEGAAGSINLHLHWENPAWPNNIPIGLTPGDRRMGAYAYYTPVKGGYVRRSGGWTQSDIVVRRSGAWATPAGTYVRRSGVWVEGS